MSITTSFDIRLAITANPINHGSSIIGFNPSASGTQIYTDRAIHTPEISDMSGLYASRLSGVRFYTGDTVTI